jgi:hypothetical protein
VAQGRIRWYGISSNTFPAASSDPQFTCLERVWAIAESISMEHHFGVVQLPMNLFESGAVLKRNQPSGLTLLEMARLKNLAVLINRPLNAFTDNRLVRLTEVKEKTDVPVEEVAERIEALADSEKVFIGRILPELGVESSLGARIQAQLQAADALRQSWRSFSGYDHWRQVRDDYLLPRIRGALKFLDAQAAGSRELSSWRDAYTGALDAAFEALGGIHAQAAARKTAMIKSALAAADPDWSGDASLSRLAVRALYSTAGVACVLVGMRRPDYVEEVLAEMNTPVSSKDRQASWQKLAQLI